MLSKVKIIILIIIFVLLAISGAAGFILLSNEYKKTQSLKKDIEELIKDKQRLEQDLTQSQQETAKLDNLLKEHKNKVQLLSEQIEKEEKLKDGLQKQIEDLSLQLNTEKEAKVTLEERISRLQGDLENFLMRFKKVEQEKTDLEARLNEYETESQLDLGTIVVEPDTEEKLKTQERETAVTKLSGRIIRLNRDYQFVVIDIGENDGVKENDVFSVYHSEQYIGDVEVERVHPAMSAANFLPNLKVNLLREQDRVVKKD